LTVMGINNERLCCAASVLLCMKFVDFWKYEWLT
jgi:hypothetical protein